MNRASPEERLSTLEAHEREHRGELEAILREIGGVTPPGRPSVRERLHVLETDAAAAKLARRVLARAERERREAQGRKWGWRERALLAAVAVAAIVLPLVNFVINVRGR